MMAQNEQTTEEQRDNTRNNARCTQARKTTHCLDGQHQNVDRTFRGRVNQNDMTRIKYGESTSMVVVCAGLSESAAAARRPAVTGGSGASKQKIQDFQPSLR